MLEQYKSPVKLKAEIKLKLTPEEKLTFRETLTSDPKYLNSVRKLEQALQSNKQNVGQSSKNDSISVVNSITENVIKKGVSKFRLQVPSRDKKSAVNGNQSTSIDASLVDVNSSFDAFDKLVAPHDASTVNSKSDSVVNTSLTGETNLELNSSFESIDLSYTKENSHFGFKKINTNRISPNHSFDDLKFNTEKTTNADASTFTVKTKFVPKKPVTLQTRNKNEIQHAGLLSTKRKNDENDKVDVDAVLIELRNQNHLPVGANRTRPPSPPPNSHKSSTVDRNKKFNRSEDMNKHEIDRFDFKDEPISSALHESSASTFAQPNTSNSLLSNRNCSNSTATNIDSSFDTTAHNTHKKTGFENLQSVLSHISESEVFKTDLKVN